MVLATDCNRIEVCRAAGTTTCVDHASLLMHYVVDERFRDPVPATCETSYCGLGDLFAFFCPIAADR